MTEFEAIFVDDCSADGTSELLRQATVCDERYRLYRNEERRGAAYSRNRGIELSRAPYILCLDADDCFEPDLLEQITDAAYAYDADAVMLERNDFYQVDLGAIKRERHQYEDEKQLLAKQPFSIKDQSIDFLLRYKTSTWNRMIKRQLLDEYQIRFQDIKNSNDVFYALFSFFAAEKIVHTRDFVSLYHRRVHNEPHRISNSRDPMCAYEALLAVHDSLVTYDLWKTYCVYFWIFALDSMENQLFVCKDRTRQKEVYDYLGETGLYRLGVERDEAYRKLPQAYQKQFRKFLEIPYVYKCFQQAMSLEALCEMKQKRLKELAERKRGERIALWGAGRQAPVFLRVYKEQGGAVACVIDIDESKQGRQIEGVEIVAFEKVWDKLDMIIIANRNYDAEIQRQVRQRSDRIQLQSLEELLYMNEEE